MSKRLSYKTTLKLGITAPSMNETSSHDVRKGVPNGFHHINVNVLAKNGLQCVAGHQIRHGAS